jgi:hypothetical protein
MAPNIKIYTKAFSHNFKKIHMPLKRSVLKHIKYSENKIRRDTLLYATALSTVLIRLSLRT